MNSSARPADLNLANWDLGGPVSEWSYRHTDKLFPTVRLVPATTASTSAPSTRADAPPELVDDLESGRVHGITILAGGQAVFRWPDKPAGPHLLMSVSKVFVSLVIGILADEDKLDYSDPVRDYLPELGEQWERCLVQHLLDMTSGVGCPEVGDPGAYSDPEHSFYRFEASLGWRPAGQSDSPYGLVLGYSRTGQPGSRYAYTSVNTFMLAWIIERITGLGYAQALQQLIWDKLTLACDSAICVNHAGVPVSYGGLIMCPDDLARFGTLFTASKPAEPHALRIPDSYLEMLRTPRHELTAPTRSWPEETHPGGQWNLIHPDGDMFKSGFGGQGLYVSPANDIVIAFCGIPDSHGQTHQLAAKCRDIAARFANSS